ncbi:MAG: hypothetical protein WC712_14680 [Candidatus Brocadiia bacterium]
MTNRLLPRKGNGPQKRPQCPFEDCTSFGSDGDVIIHTRCGEKTRFLCKTCGRTFLEEGISSEAAEKARSYAQWLLKTGKKTDEICFITGLSRRTVFRLHKGLKK